MQLFVILIIAVIFLLINYSISNNDILNPAVIFCFLNIAYITVAIVMGFVYGISFHWNTVFVLLMGLASFTFINGISWGIKRKHVILGSHDYHHIFDIQNDGISKIWILLFIAFQLLIAYLRIKYVRDAVKAVTGETPGLLSAMGKFNNIYKNNAKALRESGVTASSLDSIGWPLCIAFVFFLNSKAFIVKRKTGKWDFLYLVPFILLVLSSFIMGGRTAALRFVIALVIEYIFVYRSFNKSYHKGNRTILKLAIPVGIIVLAVLAYSINWIGRSNKIPTFEYVTAYIGAPLYNLDIYLSKEITLSSFFGKQTFRTLYYLVAPRLGIKNYTYGTGLVYHRFEGHWLGNVYTMYYPFIQDFGYIGPFVVTAVIACFYCLNYRRLMDFSRSNFGPRFLIFAYMFNDLLFSLFSNKFMESVGSALFIYFIFWTFLICYLDSKKVFRTRIKFR